MSGPKTQSKQNARTYNTIKTKCQDLQHNQNKMPGPTTQPKQNARTYYNTTKTKCQDLQHNHTKVLGTRTSYLIHYMGWNNYFVNYTIPIPYESLIDTWSQNPST